MLQQGICCNKLQVQVCLNRLDQWNPGLVVYILHNPAVLFVAVEASTGCTGAGVQPS